MAIKRNLFKRCQQWIVTFCLRVIRRLSKPHANTKQTACHQTEMPAADSCQTVTEAQTNETHASRAASPLLTPPSSLPPQSPPPQRIKMKQVQSHSDVCLLQLHDQLARLYRGDLSVFAHTLEKKRIDLTQQLQLTPGEAQGKITTAFSNTLEFVHSQPVAAALDRFAQLSFENVMIVFNYLQNRLASYKPLTVESIITPKGVLRYASAYLLDQFALHEIACASQLKNVSTMIEAVLTLLPDTILCRLLKPQLVDERIKLFVSWNQQATRGKNPTADLLRQASSYFFQFQCLVSQAILKRGWINSLHKQDASNTLKNIENQITPHRPIHDLPDIHTPQQACLSPTVPAVTLMREFKSPTTQSPQPGSKRSSAEAANAANANANANASNHALYSMQQRLSCSVD